VPEQKDGLMFRHLIPCVACVLAVAMPASLRAQAASPPAAMSFRQAMEYALEHYPTLKAAASEVAAAVGDDDVARGAWRPRLDGMWQTNRGTTNNVFGQVLPPSILPSLSGPVLASASSDSVWGSAVGALFTWEPFDFGLRDASLGRANAAVVRARAGEALTRLEVQATVGAAFLTVVADEQAVTAATADVSRRQTLARRVHALVDSQLRAGAEAARADAELAAADTRLIRARAAAEQSRIVLARTLGMTGPVAIDATALLDAVPPPPAATSDTAVHPLVQVQAAALDVARSEQRAISRTDWPRVYVQSSVFARGSGATPAGTFEGGAAGLAPDRTNWSAGLEVVLPNLFDFATRRAREDAAAAHARTEAARLEESMLTTTSEQRAASARIEAARAIAASTPLQLDAARQSETQARARYDAGLSTIVDVADTQNLLAQAEFEDRLAKVEVWRALLGQAIAQGNLSPLVALLPSSGGH
jgi:outer membrane protein TolC